MKSSMDFYENTAYFDDFLLRAGLSCPTKLFYYKEGYSINDGFASNLPFMLINKRMLKAYNKIVQLQQSEIKPDFILADHVSEASKLSYEALQKEQAICFDLNLIVEDQWLAKVEMVKKEGNTIKLYHIETKAISKPRHKDPISLFYNRAWGGRVQKAFYNKWVLQKAFPDCRFECHLIFPFKDKKAGGTGLTSLLTSIEKKDFLDTDRIQSWPKLDSEYLFEINVDEAISKNLFGLTEDQNILDSIHYLQNIHTYEGKRISPINMMCKDCEFRLSADQEEPSGFEQCWDQVGKSASDLTIFDLPGTAGREYFYDDILLAKNIDALSKVEIQEHIVNKQTALSLDDRKQLLISKEQGQIVADEIIQPKLYELLNSKAYPFYFLDFETCNFAVSNEENHTAYHTYPVMFSLHILNKDGSIEHKDWMCEHLSSSTEEEMVSQLCEMIYKEPGTLFHYSPTEAVLLKQLRKRWRNNRPATDEHFMMLDEMFRYYRSNHRMVDLKELLEKHYYNVHMNGSLSLKDIYAAMMKFENMPNVYYDLGLESVQNGSNALNALFKYYFYKDLESAQKEVLKEELKEYCKCDTISMLQIIQILIAKKQKTK